MPAKRALLSELTARELRAAIERYGLQVADRRVKTRLADALARSRKVRTAEMLQDLPRNRLKELCRALDLDDSGRRRRPSSRGWPLRRRRRERSAVNGALAFVQHMVAVLNRRGRLGVVMPHGVLFRSGAEGKIRQGMLREDLFEAVIGLAPNLFYGTGIPAAILLLNRNKPARRRGKVLFIDASGEFEEGSNQNRLRPQDIEHVAGAVRAFTDVDKYARVVPVAEIESNDCNLNISRYVDTAEEEERIDVADAVRKLRALERERAAAEATMNRYLTELGYDAQ